MNQDAFFRAMCSLDEEMVKQAGEYVRPRKKRSTGWIYAAAACLLLIVGALWSVTKTEAKDDETSSKNADLLYPLDTFAYDTYTIKDHYVDEHYAENITDLYIMGLKTDSEYYREILDFIEKTTCNVMDAPGGIGFLLSCVDYSLPAIEFPLVGTFTGTDELGRSYAPPYWHIYFPCIINGELEFIFSVMCNPETLNPSTWNLQHYVLTVDAKGRQIWQNGLKESALEENGSYYRNKDVFCIWQSLSAYTSPEKPLFQIQDSRVQGGGMYSVIGDTAYRVNGAALSEIWGERTVEKLPEIDIKYLAERGIELEVHCWPIGGK